MEGKPAGPKQQQQQQPPPASFSEASLTAGASQPSYAQIAADVDLAVEGSRLGPATGELEHVEDDNDNANDDDDEEEEEENEGEEDEEDEEEDEDENQGQGDGAEDADAAMAADLAAEVSHCTRLCCCTQGLIQIRDGSRHCRLELRGMWQALDQADCFLRIASHAPSSEHIGASQSRCRFVDGTV